MYLEDSVGNDEFQPDRGRWDSKAISIKSDEPWPTAWPENDSGGFDNARYCCFLTLEPFRSK